MANYYNPYLYPYQQAYQAPAITQNPMNAGTQNTGGIIWVQGENGAKAYPVAPNNTILLMDSENKRFYIKTADGSGMPSLRIFDYTEITASPTVSGGEEYATKKDLEALKAEILSANGRESVKDNA